MNQSQVKGSRRELRRAMGAEAVGTLDILAKTIKAQGDDLIILIPRAETAYKICHDQKQTLAEHTRRLDQQAAEQQRAAAAWQEQLVTDTAILRRGFIGRFRWLLGL